MQMMIKEATITQGKKEPEEKSIVPKDDKPAAPLTEEKALENRQAEVAEKKAELLTSAKVETP